MVSYNGFEFSCIGYRPCNLLRFFPFKIFRLRGRAQHLKERNNLILCLRRKLCYDLSAIYYFFSHNIISFMAISNRVIWNVWWDSYINVCKVRGELSAKLCNHIIVVCLHFQVLGTDELNAYLNKYQLELDSQLDALVGR